MWNLLTPEQSAEAAAPAIAGMPTEYHHCTFELLRTWEVPAQPVNWVTSAFNGAALDRRSGSVKHCLECGVAWMLVDLGFGLGWIRRNFEGEGRSGTELG